MMRKIIYRNWLTIVAVKKLLESIAGALCDKHDIANAYNDGWKYVQRTMYNVHCTSLLEQFFVIKSKKSCFSHQFEG